MLKLILIAVLAMTDAKAASTAFSIWGPLARVAKVRSGKSAQWVRQIGFQSPGCREEFTVLATHPTSWDSAFALVPADKGIQGSYGGQSVLKLSAVAPGDITGVVVSVQAFIDGKPFASPVMVSTPPWDISLPFDTTQFSNGLHVVCARAVHPDGSYSMTHAILIGVQH